MRSVSGKITKAPWRRKPQEKLKVKVNLSNNGLEILVTAVIAFFFVYEFGSSPLIFTAWTIGLVIAIPILLKKPEYAVFFLIGFLPFRDINIISLIYLKRFCIWGLFLYGIIWQFHLGRHLSSPSFFQFTKAALFFFIALGISLLKTVSEFYTTNYITPTMLKSILLSDALVILEGVLIVYIVYYFFNTFPPLQQLIDVILAVSAIVAVLGIAQYYLGGPPAMVSFLFDPEYQFYGRATSVFSNPNGLGGFLAPMIIIAFISLIWRNINIKKRFFFILPILFFDSLALIFSFSRGAVVQVLFGIGMTGYIYYFKICNRKLNWKMVGVIIIIVGVIFSAFKFYDLYLQTRLKAYSFSEYHAAVNWLETTSDFRRKHAAIKAFQTFLKNPILGIGYNLFSAKRKAGFEYFGLPAHNQYLKVLAEMGLLGFIPFMMLLVIVVRTALKTWVPPPKKRIEQERQVMMFLLLTAFSTIAFGNLFGDPLPILSCSGYLWFYAGAILVLERQYNECVMRDT